MAAKKKKKRKAKKWSGRVTRDSNALDLRHGVFTLNDPKEIAASLKRSAEQSHRRKADPYRSALSMLTFYINRAGKNLPASRKTTLNDAKGELKKLFHKTGRRRKRRRATAPDGCRPCGNFYREATGTYRTTIHLSPERHDNLVKIWGCACQTPLQFRIGHRLTARA
jgi:hypothetical protein